MQVAGGRPAAAAAACSARTVREALRNSAISLRVSARSRAVGFWGMRLAVVTNSWTVMDCIAMACMGLAVSESANAPAAIVLIFMSGPDG